MSTLVTDNVVEDFYRACARNDNNFLLSIYIPRSDVFYVRAALEEKFGEKYTLDYIEWAMLKEGFLRPQDCHNPEEKLSWSEYPKEKHARTRK